MNLRDNLLRWKNVNSMRSIEYTYCNFREHDVSDYYKKLNDERNNSESAQKRMRGEWNSFDKPNNIRRSDRCYHIASTIKENHFTCPSPNIIVNNSDLLIDTVSEVNIIKINKLKGEIIVNKIGHIFLKSCLP